MSTTQECTYGISRESTFQGHVSHALQEVHFSKAYSEGLHGVNLSRACLGEQKDDLVLKVRN